MYFSFLQKHLSGKTEHLSLAETDLLVEHRSVLFEENPAAFAQFLNKFPGCVKDAMKVVDVAVLEYGHHIVAHKQRFSDQKTFSRFFCALSDERKRDLALHGLLQSAISDDDPGFVDILLNAFPESERVSVLKRVWDNVSFSLVSKVLERAPNPAMLRKIVMLMGHEAVREMEAGRKSEPYFIVGCVAWESNADAFEILAPIIPDSTTLVKVLEGNPGRARLGMKNPRIARKIREICNEQDFWKLLSEHDGFLGICHSKDQALIEEVWTEVGPERQQLLVTSAPGFLSNVAAQNNKDAVVVLLSHATPETRMLMVRGASDVPFEAIRRWLRENRTEMITAIGSFLSDLEVSEIVASVPLSAPYLRQEACLNDHHEVNGEPVKGSRRWWQLYGQGPARWLAVLGTEAPHPDLANESPYCFSAKRYFELLPVCQLAGKIEKTSDSHIHAFKLTVLFGSAEEARKYVDKFCTEREREGMAQRGERQRLHDACQFDIPPLGDWTPPMWAQFLARNPVQGRPFIGLAPAIEKILKEDKLPFPESLTSMRDVAALIVYRRGRENPLFARIAHAYNVAEDHFDECLDILAGKGKQEDRIPDIRINGEDVGCPGYYLQRLAPGDPSGLILGHILNCCQSVGKAGRLYAIHGATSPYGGFYVWRKMNGNERSESDTIVAGSWVWIGKDNAFVFDSFERLGSAYDVLAKPFLKAVAQRALELGFLKTRLGTGGSTPKLDLARADVPSRWIDFSYPSNAEAEFDSKQQYEVSGGGT